MNRIKRLIIPSLFFLAPILKRMFAKDTHQLEVDERDRRKVLRERREALNDSELKTELTKQYGKSGWASKLIREILKKRIILRNR